MKSTKIHTFRISPEKERSSRQSEYANELRQMTRDGVKLRAATFIDRRKEASRKACRGKNSANW